MRRKWGYARCAGRKKCGDAVSANPRALLGAKECGRRPRRLRPPLARCAGKDHPQKTLEKNAAARKPAKSAISAAGMAWRVSRMPAAPK